MESKQERLYIASQLIGAVANCLIDNAGCGLPLEFEDLMELVGRLDIAIEAIRFSNGAANN
jgi:hypothetical protein